MTDISASMLRVLLCRRTTFYHLSQELKLEQNQNVGATQLESHIKLSILIICFTHQASSKEQKGINVTKKLLLTKCLGLTIYLWLLTYLGHGSKTERHVPISVRIISLSHLINDCVPIRLLYYGRNYVNVCLSFWLQYLIDSIP